MFGSQTRNNHGGGENDDTVLFTDQIMSSYISTKEKGGTFDIT